MVFKTHYQKIEGSKQFPLNPIAPQKKYMQRWQHYRSYSVFRMIHVL